MSVGILGPVAAAFVGAIARGSGIVGANLPIASTLTVCNIFDTEVLDTDGYFNPASPNQMTIPAGRAGRHRVSAEFELDGDGLADDRQVWIHVRVNGAVVYTRSIGLAGAQGVSNSFGVSHELTLAAGDVVTIAGQLWNSAAVMSFAGNPTRSRFVVEFLGV